MIAIENFVSKTSVFNFLRDIFSHLKQNTKARRFCLPPAEWKISKKKKKKKRSLSSKKEDLAGMPRGSITGGPFDVVSTTSVTSNFKMNRNAQQKYTFSTVFIISVD